MNINLWIEKFRPSTLDEYVGNEDIKKKCEQFIQNNEIPHLLFHGRAGTGKTTLAKILVNHIDCDYLYINASAERGIDIVRDKIRNFASSVGFKKWKVIILDESDYMTPDAQASLRNTMEVFAGGTRFILTCNYPEKIIEPLQSRCQTFKIQPPSMKDIAIKCANILKEEGVSFEPSDLKVIIENDYPDIRKILGDLQSNVFDNQLKLSSEFLSKNDVENKVIDVLCNSKSKKDKFTEIRQILLDTIGYDYTNLYSLLFKRIDEYGKGNIGQIILIIAEGQHRATHSVDKEISAMATIVNILETIG